jgi:asparagine synthase (glutamine-hydrolysing)
MGVKPFYYYRSNKIFAFASEIKALLCLPEVPRELNELRVAYHLALLFEDQTITFYQNILRLPGAHTITVGSEKTQIQRYWSLDPTREIRLRSNQEYTEAFREIFTQAVRLSSA